MRQTDLPKNSWARPGLRSRVTAAFALGALVLSASMALITYLSARQAFIHERESSALRQATGSASILQPDLHAPGGSVPPLLSSVDTAGSSSVLEYKGQWYATSVSIGKSALPGELRALVISGRPAYQIVMFDGSPQMMVGIPLPGDNAAYFEVIDLGELVSTLRSLALVLSGAAFVTTVLGAAVGRWASGRALRPLADVSKAAETIAGGQLDTRLTTESDPDLQPLATSFNRMADALQERLVREARFASDVSHELRSPLTTLATSLGVLETNNAQLGPRAKQALGLLGGDLRRFQRMVDDLLEISRMDAGSAELLLDEVEVNELVYQIAATSAAKVPVNVHPLVANLRLAVDKRRIERIVANLIANAEHYAGGATGLSAEPGEDSVLLVVSDRGPGVAPGEREKIFERFYRGEAAGKRGATDGSGLGLSLVAEHLRLHGGRAWVEEGLDGENRFVAELPLGSTVVRQPAEEPEGTE